MLKKSVRRRSTEERRLRGLLELAPDAMVVVDQAGVIVLANTQAERLFGYRQQEVLGHHVEVLIPERFRERHREHRTNFFSEPRVRPMGANLQLFALRKNGTEFPVEISLSPVETAEGMLVASAIRDVSERKVAEESRLRLAAIVESSDDAIISKTPDGIIVSWNAGAQQVYGYSEDEAIGKPITILAPSELVNEENKILERLRAGERIAHYETLRITKSGRRINISLSLSPIKDTTGTMLGTCGISRDITQRKMAEQALADMTRKLIEAQEQERARIARELHDDIGQRVAMLAIESERLERRPEAASEIRNTAHEISELIRELATDIQALSHELHSSKLEYLGIVGGMKSWCREFGERQGMQIEFKNSGSFISLPSQTSVCLLRVLQEALHNSAKHSGVKNVEVQLRSEPGELQLIVHDLGEGFDVAAAMQGRGLGITSMLERVRLLGGTVSIDSKPHGGTTICACIPVEAHQAQKAGL